MTELEMPRNLVRALEEDADGRLVRGRWMAALPLIVDELARRWTLDLADRSSLAGAPPG